MDKEQQLRDRLDKNLDDYRRQVFGMWKHEIVEMSGRITAMSDAHFYLQNHHEFEPEQVEYLLKLEKPLDLLADAWQKRTEDISDMSFALDEVFSERNISEPLQHNPKISGRENGAFTNNVKDKQRKDTVKRDVAIGANRLDRSVR